MFEPQEDDGYTVSLTEYRLMQQKLHPLTVAIRLELMRMAARMRLQENPQ